MGPNKDEKLSDIFSQLKRLLASYVPPLVVRTDAKGRYEIEFDKDYEVKSERTGRVTKKHGLYFAGIIIQSGYVGLYFMPIAARPSAFGNRSARIKGMLKGKSCLYVKGWDKELEAELETLLRDGYELFDKM